MLVLMLMLVGRVNRRRLFRSRERPPCELIWVRRIGKIRSVRRLVVMLGVRRVCLCIRLIRLRLGLGLGLGLSLSCRILRLNVWSIQISIIRSAPRGIELYALKLVVESLHGRLLWNRRHEGVFRQPPQRAVLE